MLVKGILSAVSDAALSAQKKKMGHSRVAMTRSPAQGGKPVPGR